MPIVIELSYWNIHSYTFLYVVFIIIVFLILLRELNRNDDTSVSFFSFLTTSQKKDNMKKQLQLVRDEYEIAKTVEVNRKTAQKIREMYNDLASAISIKLQFPQIKTKLRAFQDKYKYLWK